ncbi:hypothetical protein D6D01_09073 [Aureobasidium pullulans]|uniref:Uncharacterized protein n=1 Tax=Aureobasidium pullulans TaxID=5580 RepID=A0A4S9K6H5_AURPU|nr:hypothetical protein D6D01_09073 [Aureobasidium pullulans]
MDQVDARLWREFNRGREMAHFKRQIAAAMESNDNDNNSTPVDLDEYKSAQLERDLYGVMNPEHIGRDANFNILSALPPADTDASEFVECGSANDDTGSRETPIVVDDDTASAASSETLRADSPSPSPYSDSDDAGDAHRSDELSQLGVEDLDDEVDDYDSGDDENIYSDDSDGDSNAVDNMLRENGETYGCDTASLIGDINGDSETDSLSNEASYPLHEKSKTLVEQFDRVSETMYIVETNLVALEDHLQRGASLHDLSYLLESFIRLRDMVGEMESKVSHLGDEAVLLSVNSHIGDIAAEKVNDGLRNMPLTFNMRDVNNTVPTLNHPSAPGHRLMLGTRWHRCQLRMLNFATRHTIRIVYSLLVHVTITLYHQLLLDLHTIFVNQRYRNRLKPATLQAPMHTHNDAKHLMTTDIKLLVVGVRCMEVRLAKVQSTPVNRVEALTLPRLAEELTIRCILGPCDN